MNGWNKWTRLRVDNFYLRGLKPKRPIVCACVFDFSIPFKQIFIIFYSLERKRHVYDSHWKFTNISWVQGVWVGIWVNAGNIEEII